MHSDPSSASGVHPAGPHRWHADLDPAYAFGDRLNGGYLLAVAAQAARAELGADGDGWRVVHATARYLAAPDPGPAQVAVAVSGRSRRTASLTAVLRQGATTCLEAAVTFRQPAEHPGTADWTRDDAPGLPDPEGCFLLPTEPPGADFRIPLMGVLDVRMDPDCLGFAVGAPTGRGELRAWVAPAGAGPDRPVDDSLVLLASDALPPAVFDLGPLGWVPTLALDVHVLAPASPGPLQVRQRVAGVSGDLLTQLCDVWDATGRLVAHATQLALMPKGLPPTTA